MKVSLRYKLPLVILVGFLIFLLLLVIYYRVFLSESRERDFDVFNDHLFEINDAISDRIKEYYPDRRKIAAYIEEASARQDLKITVYDVDGNKIWEADRRRRHGLSLELKSFTVVSRDAIYVVELTLPFSSRNLVQLDSTRKIGWAALILLFVGIGLLIIYLHFSLVQPLTSLNRGLETVNFNNAPDQANLETLKRRDELGDLTGKFTEMRQRLAASYRQQNEMIASISHDLKTPLTSIMGFLERLISHQLPADKQAEYHEIIFQKARDIQELINEFNEYVLSDIDNVDKEEVRVADFLNELAVEYRCELEGKNISFNCLINIDNERRIKIAPRQIRRVFANLVNNALKHAANLSKIEMTGAVRDGYVWFTVEDDGSGAPEQELAALFEKFYRLDKSRSRAKGGSGLGLAICQRIVESHGGSIQAYLNSQGGLGVRFSLPLKK
ncbi:MAG: HAMP domain-containing histidine kinase [Firmicutes bacterium]|nr:HAMP domain-containing histidine kinase [Bacillota bacterium]